MTSGKYFVVAGNELRHYFPGQFNYAETGVRNDRRNYQLELRHTPVQRYCSQRGMTFISMYYIRIRSLAKNTRSLKVHDIRELSAFFKRLIFGYNDYPNVSTIPPEIVRAVPTLR